MNPRLLLIVSVLVIFAILCSPVLAIRKSDLISYYKGEQPVTQDVTGKIPNGSENFSTIIIWPIILPTPTPTPRIPVWAVPTPFPSTLKSLFSSWFISPSVKPTIAPTPTITPSSPSGCVYASCPPAVPVGWLEPATCNCTPAYRDVGEAVVEVFGEECIDPETGESYPIGRDAFGNCYLEKPGCPVRCVGFA
jgi:hypothetical protein